MRIINAKFNHENTANRKEPRKKYREKLFHNQKHSGLYTINTNNTIDNPEIKNFYLIFHCISGNLSRVKKSIREGADIHHDNDQALASAFKFGHAELVRFLIKSNANISTLDDYSISKILLNETPDYLLLKFLLDHQPYNHIYEELLIRTIMLFAEFGNRAIIKWMVERHIKFQLVATVSSLILLKKSFLAAHSLINEILSSLCATVRILRPLLHLDEINIIKELCYKGANLHANYEELLKFACSTSKYSYVNYLLAAGADIHADCDHALRIAANCKDKQMVELLIDSGADINTGLFLPFVEAVINGEYFLAYYYLEKGFDINYSGSLPLRLACCMNNVSLDAVQFMAMNGAMAFACNPISYKINYENANLTYLYNRSAIHIAYFLKKDDILISLLSIVKDKRAKHIINLIFLAHFSQNLQLSINIIMKFYDLMLDFSSLTLMAAKDKQYDLVTSLLDYTLNIHKQHESIFLSACRYGNLPIIKALVKKGAFIFADINQPLYSCLCNKKYDMASYLMNAGADIYDFNCVVIMGVCYQGDFDTIKFLEKKGIDLHSDNEMGLQGAAAGGQLITIKYLLSKGANIHAGNDMALFRACMKDQWRIIDFLISQGADVHADKSWIIRWACNYGNYHLVKYLIEKDSRLPSPEMIATSLCENYERYYAYKYNHEMAIFYHLNSKGISLFDKIDHYINLAIKNDKNQFAEYLLLFYSSLSYKRGKISSINLPAIATTKLTIKDLNDFLLEKHLSLYSRSRDPFLFLFNKRNRSSLIMIVRKELEYNLIACISIKLLLSENNLFASSLLTHQVTRFYSIIHGLLICACRNNNPSIVKTLIESGIDLHFNNEESLLTACHKKHFSIVKYLCNQGANIHIYGELPLKIASDKNDFKLIDLFVGLKANINIGCVVAFCNACIQKKFHIADYYIKKGFNIRFMHNLPLRLINGVKKNTSLKIIKYLISRGANFIDNTPIGPIVKCKYSEFISMNSAVEVSTGHGRLDILKFFLSEREKYSSKNTTTLIFLLLLIKDIITLKKILLPYSMIFATSFRLLIISATNKTKKITRYLLNNAMNINIYMNDSFVQACKKGDLFFVKYFVKNGFDISTEKNLGMYLLLSNKHYKIADYLISHGLDIKAFGNRLLTKACQEGAAHVIKYLIENGVDIRTNSEIALKHACAAGRWDVIDYLIDEGADIHAGNEIAIRYACANGHARLMYYLIKRGADFHSDNEIALRWTARNIVDIPEAEKLSNHYEISIIKYLVEEKGVDIHVNNDETLRLALENKKYELAKYLISLGADITHCDNLSLTKQNYADVLEILEKSDNEIQKEQHPARKQYLDTLEVEASGSDIEDESVNINIDYFPWHQYRRFKN